MNAPDEQADDAQSTALTHPPSHATTHASEVIDTGVNLANTVVTIVKEVSELMSAVPYVKALSGVILQIIKIREEIKSNKERCRELIEKVLRISKSIYERLADIATSNAQEKLARLEGHLGDCNRTLLAVYDALEKQRSRRPLAKLINRGLDELNALDRRVDELNIKLILDILVDIKLEQVASTGKETQSSTPNGSGHILPPKPYLMVERDTQLDSALTILLNEAPSRIALLGGGGFGKTTLARAILHAPQITARYPSRYFLSCEGMADVDALLLGLGSMLGITAPPSAVLASVRSLLAASTTVLCLDNFETPWEPSAGRTGVEDVLASLADIPNLSLIITMRGVQRPSKIAWSPPLLPPLSTLSPDSARQILQTVCPEHDVDALTEQLLDGIDGIPLAITLVANLFRDGETSQSLWRRWSKKQTGIIHTGGDDRQSSLNASIALSVESPRMKRDPDASVLLAVLSLLPSGFPSDADALTKLEEYLGMTDIDSAFHTLRTVSLVETGLSSTARIQMLSPIRLFCHEFLSSTIASVLEKVTGYYNSIMLHAEDKRWVSALYNQIVPEIQNLHSVFQRAYKAGYSQDISALINATVFLTSWSQYIGYLARDTLQMAIERSTDFPIAHAKCLLALGDLVRTEGQNKAAEQHIQEAAALFQNEHDTQGEARATYILGRVLLDMRQLDDALSAFQASLALYTEGDYPQGQANAQFSMGQIYMETERHPEAEASLKGASEAYKKKPDLLGQSNAASSLALLYVKVGNLTEGEKFAAQALAAAKEAQYALGEGNALQKLGAIFLGTDRVPEAWQAFEQVHAITKAQHHYANHLGVLDDLGEAYIRSDQLSAAEALLTEAIQPESDAIQVAYVLATLGWLYICQGRLDKAESVLDDALQRFKKFNDKAWQVKVLAHLGTVYFKSHRLDDAAQVLESIPDITRLRAVEIHRLSVLGDLYTVQGKFDDAQRSLDAALALCQNREYSFAYQQGNILRSRGVLLTKQDRVEPAVLEFEEAREFHRKAQWVSEQATDLDRLGEAYEMLGKTEEAKAVRKEAEALMETVREARGVP